MDKRLEKAQALLAARTLARRQEIATLCRAVERMAGAPRYFTTLDEAVADLARYEAAHRDEQGPSNIRPEPSGLHFTPNPEQGDNIMETITLHNVAGFARKTGRDEHGNVWAEFSVDRFADQESGECAICGEEIESGWLCLDGGEEVCDSHVVISADQQDGLGFDGLQPDQEK